MSVAQTRRRADADHADELKSPNVVPIRQDSDGDPLASFKPEREDPPALTAKPPVVRVRVPKRIWIAAALTVAVGATVASAWVYGRGRATLPVARPSSP